MKRIRIIFIILKWKTHRSIVSKKTLLKANQIRPFLPSSITTIISIFTIFAKSSRISIDLNVKALQILHFKEDMVFIDNIFFSLPSKITNKFEIVIKDMHHPLFCFCWKSGKSKWASWSIMPLASAKLYFTFILLWQYLDILLACWSI